MAFRQVKAFSAPIPGQGMTAEPKSRPWNNPPKYNNIEEALEFYIPSISEKSVVSRLVQAMEKGIPITVLAETITSGGVMQGLHTIDVAILLNPIIIEFLKGIAENAGIKYVLGDKTLDDEKPDPSIIKDAMQKFRENRRSQAGIQQMPIEEEMPQEATEGLMSRRGEIE
tara:strand:- start:3272 stop:3781 length:510 start_codon:yes stop_codon:yes gene_type:complete